MKKKISLIGILFIITASLLGISTGCEEGNGDTDNIVGSGNLITINKDFNNFYRVEAGPSFTVNLTYSNIYKISVTTDDNLMDYVTVSKSGETLKLNLKENTSPDFTSLIVEITMPTLSELYLEASTHGTIQGFNSLNDLYVELSASSTLLMNDMTIDLITSDIAASSSLFGDILVNKAIFKISASSVIELEGSANDMTLDVSASSTAKLDNFLVESIDAKISASSHAWVFSSVNLDANVSALSYLSYLGEPTLGDIDIDSSSIIQHG